MIRKPDSAGSYCRSSDIGGVAWRDEDARYHTEVPWCIVRLENGRPLGMEGRQEVRPSPVSFDPLRLSTVQRPKKLT
jgi:hypothetical protein